MDVLSITKLYYVYFHYLPFIHGHSSALLSIHLSSSNSSFYFSTVVWGFDMKAAAVLRQMSSTQVLSAELTSLPTNSNADSHKELTEEVRHNTYLLKR